MDGNRPGIRQMSDSMIIMVLLTLSGGLQDAYSYFVRDQVFANAQTGNIVLMSFNLFSGNVRVCLRYLVPVLAFACGVLAAEQIRARYPSGGRIHWRQLVVSGEVVLLFVVGFLPGGLNWLANALASFSCAMQVQSFRAVNGSAYASTMCIGNLRSGTAHLSAALRTGDRAQLCEAGKYFLIIGLFALGAGIGGCLVRLFAFRTIWASCALLLAAFLLMLRREGEP